MNTDASPKVVWVGRCQHGYDRNLHYCQACEQHEQFVEVMTRVAAILEKLEAKL